jgi:4-alpha-glucanotransferase
MPVSALPSPYGIGTFGKAAFQFVDFLYECRQSYWQVLPLNPTSFGDSPYQSPASIAGNPYFIDPMLLFEDGLLTKGDLAELKIGEGRIDYGRLFYTRYPILRRAYARFVGSKDYATFCEENASWLEDYALFMALKVHNEYRPWTTWDEDHRDVKIAREKAQEFEVEMGFWRWVQYEFMKQWQAVRAYAHKKGISIIGDMPIYVAHDSMDVWRAPEQFLLDEKDNPTVVAGCPPDAYAEDGQLWGNPIYDWDKMKTEGFAWWLDRIGKSFTLYDVLRIDHFRGFAGYYTIPFGEETAKNGQWNRGPGMDLFRAVKETFPAANIIAEDLGFITDDVRDLLRDTAFPGMKVLQFAFYDDNSEYLPRTYATDNCIVYASTHDSDCTRSWYENLDDAARARFKRECPRHKGQSATLATVELALSSRADLAVIALQDYLELTNEQGRINVPSRAEGNWSWRVSPRYATAKRKDMIKTLAISTGRAK